MSYLTVEVTRTDQSGDTETLTDWTSITIRKGLDQKANTVDVAFKNVLNRKPNNETKTFHRWVGDDGELIWQENDTIEIKAAHQDVQASLTDTDTITVADALEFNAKLESQRTPLTVSGADKTFALLNQNVARAFPLSDAKTSYDIIKEIIENATENPKGDGTFEVTATLQNEATYDLQKASSTPGIQTLRINDTDFPEVAMAKVYKPVYEWIEDLSTVEATNNFDGRDSSLATDSEDSPVQKRKMVYFVDKDNNFRWFYPDSDVDYTIEIGDVAEHKDDVKSYSLKKTTFDIVNFVIYNGGLDLYGAGTLNYFFDINTTSGKLLSKYKAYNHIAIETIQEEINAGNLVSNTSGSFTFQGNRYNAASYGFTTSWGVDTTGFSDDDYNNSLRSEIDSRCKGKARAFTAKRGNPRWKGSITIKGRNFVPGELINLTSYVHGINGVNVRINDLTHQIRRDGWTTTVEVEEDDDEEGQAVS